jgi:hypothetical protein
MRKIKSNFFISLEGVVEPPDKWHFPYFNDEMGVAIGAGAGSMAIFSSGSGTRPASALATDSALM